MIMLSLVLLLAMARSMTLLPFVHNEYRPVTLTCIMCKVYEKLIREYILDGIEAVLSSKQHGFMRGRSGLSNLLETMDAVNDLLAEGGCADILYFDFSKVGSGKVK